MLKIQKVARILVWWLGLIASLITIAQFIASKL